MPNIDSDLIRGNIDTIILKTMVDGDKYGLDIIKEVESRSNGTYELKQPTLYSCLKRLENQELISSYWLDSDIGGRRHYYKLTDKGRETLQKKQEEWSKSKFIIDNLLSNFNYDEYRLVKKDDYDRIIEGKKFTYEPKDEDELNAENEIDENVTIDNGNESETSNDSITTLSDEETEETEESENDYNNYADTESEEKLEETETENDDSYIINDNEDNVTDENFEDDEEDEMVYVSSSNASEETQEDETGSSPTYNSINQTAQESNILAKLRSQDDEEINTYVGDKNSYINHLNQNQNVVQQNLLDMDLYYSEEVDDKIDEFSTAIENLNNFSSDGETAEVEEPSSVVEESAEQEEYSEISQTNQVSNDTLQIKTASDDFLSELDELDYDNNSSFFKSDEDVDYLPSNEQVEEKEAETSNDYYEAKVEKPQHDEHDYYFSRIQEHNDDELEDEDENDDVSSVDTIANQSIQEQDSYDNDETNYVDNNENNTYSYSDFDSIISETASNYKTENTEYQEKTYEPFRPSYTGESYKKKLSDLSKYSKISLNQDDEQENQSQENVKDIETLKQEFEKEGIKIREYKRDNDTFVERNYMLINKLNLIKSLILLFGYIFVLSAVYIILNNTAFRNTQGFSISYFLYAFIPFAVYALYYLILYLINPYKKVPAKYAPRIMFLISVIVTVQLLLITYCVNLQLGFYSFTQSYYNHLLWIIPGIISFAPIFSNIIFVSLFYSKNFNV